MKCILFKLYLIPKNNPNEEMEKKTSAIYLITIIQNIFFSLPSKPIQKLLKKITLSILLITKKPFCVSQTTLPPTITQTTRPFIIPLYVYLFRQIFQYSTLPPPTHRNSPAPPPVFPLPLDLRNATKFITTVWYVAQLIIQVVIPQREALLRHL